MLNPIKTIVAWNQKAGLLDAGYDDARESAFPIEEALEGLNDLVCLADELSIPNNGTDYKLPKLISRNIISIAHGHAEAKPLSDVDRLDKHCDQFVFAVGSMAKLGLSPQQITQAVNIVMEANMQKLQCKTDSSGKLGKPADFVNPEPKLQILLDKRNVN